MRPNAYARDRAQTYSHFSNDAPVYNDQLQNLDMELKILERQREIIKQKRQSQMMSQSQNVYNQPSSSYGHAESKNASAYQRKGKRPFEGSWQNQSPAKQARIYPWETLYDNPQPLMKIHTNHYNKSNFTNIKHKPRTDIKSTNAIRMKDFVPKKYAMSNVKKTPDNSAPVPNVDKKCMSKEILRPYVEPSPSMKGRLEFALGHITKQLRQSKNIDEQTLKKFKMPTALRAVKNIIRQRISDVMMNKVVGTAFDILDHYRKKYPNDVDEEIIQAINSSPKPYENRTVFVKPIPIKESEKIKKFFTSKMNKLLKSKMAEMIEKLSIIYDNESDILKCLEDLPDIEDIDEEDLSEGNENKDEAEKKSDNAIEVSVEIDKADANKDGIESPKTEANKDGSENDKADVSRDSIEGDNADANNDSIESDKTDEDNIIGEDISKDANVSDSSIIEVKSANEAVTNDDEIKESNVETAEEKPVKNKKIKQYYKLMDLLIGKRLPVLMENFKEDFINLISLDKDFMTAKQNVVAELKIQLKAAYADAAEDSTKAVSTEPGKETSPLSELAEVNKLGKESSKEKKQENEKDDKKEPGHGAGTQKSGQLCVMLLGRPSLPPKPLIYEFLNKYKPQSIKKHKTVSNLLVISFNNEEDYNNILAANESKVGEATFIIKANEVIAADKQNEPTTTVNKNISAGYETKQTSEETNQDSKENKINEDVIEDKKDTSNRDETEICEAKNIDDKDVMEVNEANDDDDVKEIVAKNQVVIDISEDSQDNDSKKANGSKTTDMETIEESAENDVIVVEKAVVQNANVVKETAVGTPTRSSSRLANTAPSTIKTRRASRLAQ